MSHNILIIEDDQVIAVGLKQALTLENYQVSIANNGDDGLFMAQSESPDLVILDIMMPGLNGFEVITELRRHGNNVAIIILSARTEVQDRIRGLDLGADDYMCKPFDLDELLARVRRIFNKFSANQNQFGDYIYDWNMRSLTQNAHLVSLQTKERILLEFLLKRSGQIVAREQILDNVWGSDYGGTDRTVDNVIVSLRKKIGAKYIITERGLGYRFMTK